MSSSRDGAHGDLVHRAGVQVDLGVAEAQHDLERSPASS